jgi:hypothetical protein
MHNAAKRLHLDNLPSIDRGNNARRERDASSGRGGKIDRGLGWDGKEVEDEVNFFSALQKAHTQSWKER